MRIDVTLFGHGSSQRKSRVIYARTPIPPPKAIVLDDPTPFVPLLMKKHGKEIAYEAKTLVLARRR